MSDEEKKKENGQPQQFGQPYNPQQFGQPANGRSFDSGVKVQQPEVSKQEEGTPYDNLQNPYEERRKVYEDIITQLKGEKADEEARERRNRARAAVSGIADAAKAFSSLYYTTKYAPETYKEGVSGQYRKRADEARAKRDKLRDELLNYYKQQGDNDVAAAGWDAQMANYKANWNQRQQDRAERQQAREDANNRWHIEHTYRKNKDAADAAERQQARKDANKYQQAHLALQQRAQRLAESKQSDGQYNRYMLDDGNFISITASTDNEHNITKVWEKIPSDKRTVILDDYGRPVAGYPSKTVMLMDIAVNGNNPKVANEFRRIGGIPPKAYPQEQQQQETKGVDATYSPFDTKGGYMQGGGPTLNQPAYSGGGRANQTTTPKNRGDITVNWKD